jgi:pimeloyl-ACP methyl ester carboxylesterase
VVAEINGNGLDLSAEPLEFSAAELAGIDQPTLIVSSEQSPDVLRRINDHLATLLPHTQQVLVTGGHLIHPAHPAVLNFVTQVLALPAERNTD